MNVRIYDGCDSGETLVNEAPAEKLLAEYEKHKDEDGIAAIGALRNGGADEFVVQEASGTYTRWEAVILETEDVDANA